jgi:hypothetical protein
MSEFQTPNLGLLCGEDKGGDFLSEVLSVMQEGLWPPVIDRDTDRFPRAALTDSSA